MKLKTTSKVTLLSKLIKAWLVSMKEPIVDALKEEDKLLKTKVLNLEHKLSQSEAHVNNLDQYNQRNNLEIQGFPST